MLGSVDERVEVRFPGEIRLCRADETWHVQARTHALTHAHARTQTHTHTHTQTHTYRELDQLFSHQINGTVRDGGR